MTIQFTVNLIESTREITLTSLFLGQTISLGIVKDKVSVNEETYFSYLEDIPTSFGRVGFHTSDIKLETITENFDVQAPQILADLQNEFPKNVSYEVQDNLLKLSILVSPKIGFELRYISE